MKHARALAHLGLWGFFVIGIPALFLSASIPVQADADWNMGTFLRQILPKVFGLLLAAGVVTWIATGTRGLRHALGWILGSRKEETAALAARALGAAANATLALGIVAPLFLLVTMGAHIARMSQGAPSVSPALSHGFSGVLIAPLFALLLGRAVFGGLAARAASVAGLPTERSLRGWSGFAVPLLIVFVTCLLLFTTIFRIS